MEAKVSLRVPTDISTWFKAHARKNRLKESHFYRLALEGYIAKQRTSRKRKA